MPTLLCCALGVIGLGLALGAVIPPLGDALDVNQRGVGNMFGYLLGALFFGGFGVAGLRIWRRGHRRRSAMAVVEPLPVDETPLLPGPGLMWRWLGAVPLMLLATAVPVLGSMTLGAWIGVANNIPLFDDRTPTFGEEFSKTFDIAGPASIIPAGVLLVFLLRRNMFTLWPKACLWTAVIALAPTAFISIAIELSAATLPNAALAIGLVWLNYWIGRAALWVLSRPVADDLVASELEIPFHIPGSRARLRIQRDRLLLDRLRAAKSNVHKAIAWSALRSVTVDHQTTPTRWQASSGQDIEVPEGPALHIVADNDEWLLPVPDPLGEDLAAAITARANLHRRA